jgi:hypothetical protein
MARIAADITQIIGRTPLVHRPLRHRERFRPSWNAFSTEATRHFFQSIEDSDRQSPKNQVSTHSFRPLFCF